MDDAEHTITEEERAEITARLDAALEKANSLGHPLSGEQAGFLVHLLRADQLREK